MCAAAARNTRWYPKSLGTRSGETQTLDEDVISAPRPIAPSFRQAELARTLAVPPALFSPLNSSVETADALQGDEIMIYCLGYRPVTLQLAQLHLVTRCFVFRPATSGVATPGSCNRSSSGAFVSRAQFPLPQQDQEPPTMRFISDGATQVAGSSAHAGLSEYLATRSLDIEVWNSESLQHVGSATVELAPLVRHGRAVASFDGEYAVRSESGDVLGWLQLLLSCRGLAAELAVPATAASASTRRRYKARATGATGRGSMPPVSDDPITWPSERMDPIMWPSSPIADGRNVVALRMLQHQDWPASVGLASPAEVHVEFGSTTHFALPLENSSDCEVSFDIALSEVTCMAASPQRDGCHFSAGTPRRQLASEGVMPPQHTCSLSLVTDPEYWRDLVQRCGLRGPPGDNYKMLLIGSASHGRVLMPPRTRIDLPFRCHSFEGIAPEFVHSGGGCSNTASLIDVTREVGSSCRMLTLSTHVVGDVARAPKTSTEICVHSWPSPVDSTLRFYDAFGTHVSRRVSLDRLVCTASRNSSSALSVYCTDPSIGVRWTNFGKLLVLRIPVPDGPTSQARVWFLVLYDAHDMSMTQKPVAVHRVEMHGMFVERIPARVGIASEFLMHVPASVVSMANSCTASCWSSAPDLVAPRAQQLNLLPGGSLSVPVRVSATLCGEQQCRLFVVSNTAPELLASILVVVDAAMPFVQASHEVVLATSGVATLRELRFRNESAAVRHLSIRSSDSSICSVRTLDVTVGAFETCLIELECGPVESGCCKDIFLFIESHDMAVQEVRLLRISFACGAGE